MSWGRCVGGADVKEPERSIPFVPFSLEKKHPCLRLRQFPFQKNMKWAVRTRALHRFREKDENGHDLIDV